MVCGYCSHEQPLGEQCKHCGKCIARSAKGAIGAATTHWQVCTLLSEQIALEGQDFLACT